jgi:hypothetical protein
MDLAIALSQAGLGSYYWGPDLSTYQTLAAGWPEGNPPLPSETELQAAYQAATAPTAAEVKGEAARRILAILPEWKQRNLTARAAELAKIGQANWTQAEADEWAAGQALWDQIKAIRAKSDQIEAMDPIPADFADDTYWTA